MDPRHPYGPPELSPAFLASQPERTEESPKAQVGPLTAAEEKQLMSLLDRYCDHPTQIDRLAILLRVARDYAEEMRKRPPAP